MKTGIGRSGPLAVAMLGLLAGPTLADGEQTSPLIDTSWQLTSLADSAVSTTTTSTLTISADRIGGNGGCNTYGGDVVISDPTIAISNVFSTMMACEGLSQEQALFAALEASRTYTLDGQNLQLHDQNGAVIAEFKPAG